MGAFKYICKHKYGTSSQKDQIYGGKKESELRYDVWLLTLLALFLFPGLKNKTFYSVRNSETLQNVVNKFGRLTRMSDFAIQTLLLNSSGRLKMTD